MIKRFHFIKNSTALFILAIVAVAMTGQASFAAEKLKVGVYESSPFAMKDELGNWEGVTIDLWAAIAKDIGVEYVIVEGAPKQIFMDLAAGKLDVIAGALPITSELEKYVDYSHPYYAADWALAVPKGQKTSLGGAILRVFLSWQLLAVIAGIVIIPVLIGVIIWYVEGRESPEDFGSTPLEGITYGLYWAIAMMTGTGEKAPRSIHGRMIAMIWIFAGVFVTSTFTASVTTLLYAEHVSGRIMSEKDLPNARVAVIRGTCDELIRQKGADVEICFNLKECFDMLMQGKVDAVAGGEPTLEEEAFKRKNKISVINMDYEEVFYALGLRPGSPFTERINSSLLKTTASPEWSKLLKRYME